MRTDITGYYSNCKLSCPHFSRLRSHLDELSLANRLGDRRSYRHSFLPGSLGEPFLGNTNCCFAGRGTLFDRVARKLPTKALMEALAARGEE